MIDNYFFILKDKLPVMTTNIVEWGQHFDIDERRVALDQIGDIEVSTVFLGIDHAFYNGPPLLFETMVFGGAYDQEMKRYSTWEQAEKGHAEIVKRIKKMNAGEKLDRR